MCHQVAEQLGQQRERQQRQQRPLAGQDGVSVGHALAPNGELRQAEGGASVVAARRAGLLPRFALKLVSREKALAPLDVCPRPAARLWRSLVLALMLARDPPQTPSAGDASRAAFHRSASAPVPPGRPAAA